ncbi:hypothetical protein DPMN_014357 [Dreissena polymorpha]|uniref:Uncharacterized protein n=1 Tax=Dreissena polymorpha TaxID=45954 RepID=A0A9D4S3D7_DREPO|nr:hypothetical protein DPMN_014357 [Dreissena polymorpha]
MSYISNAVSSQYYYSESCIGYILLPMLVISNAVSSHMPYQASTTSESYTGYILLPTPGCSYISNAVSSSGTLLASHSGNAVPSQYYTSDNAVSSQYYTSESYTGISYYPMLRVIYRIYPTTPCSYLVNAVSSQYYTSVHIPDISYYPHARILSNAVSSQYLY